MRVALLLLAIVASLCCLPPSRGNAAPSSAGPARTDPLSAAGRLATMAEAVLQSDPARAARLAQDSEALAAKAPGGTPRLALAMATAQWLEGDAALRLNHAEQAEPLIGAALRSVAREQSGSRLHGRLLMSRADLESSRNQVQPALADYLAAFAIFGAVRDARDQAAALQDIGLIYAAAGDFNRALYYYSSSRDTFSGDTILDLSLSNNRANALGALGRYGDSELEYMRALALARRLGSALLQAQILNNLAVAQNDDNKPDAARASVTRGLEVARSGPAAAWRPLLLGTFAQVALKQDKLPEARALLDAAFAEHNSGIDTQPYEYLHQGAYLIYKKQGDNVRALQQFEIYQRLQAEGQALTASTNSALLAARFDFSNQNARIATLKAGQLQRDIALTRLRARQSQVVLGGLLIFVTGLILLLGLYLRSLRRSRDITQEANARLHEVNVELEQALLAKSQFLATTSHEIRTPLNGVLGMTQVLLADGQLGERVKQRVALIHGAGEAMRILVDDLLDLSKMDAGPVELRRDDVDLPALLADVCQFWAGRAQTKGLLLKADLDQSPTTINEDAHRLRQILSNLLSNAIKFTPAGSICLSVATEAAEGGELLLVKIEDTGIGIPANDREKVFEKFTQLDGGTTRKYGGTGLGLAIARTLARAMGGDLTIADSPQGGSTFTLALPLRRVEPKLETPRSQRAAPPSRLSEAHVVMIEANPIRQGAFRAILEGEVSSLTLVATVEGAVDRMANDDVDLLIASLPFHEGAAPAETSREAERLIAEAAHVHAPVVIIVDDGDPAWNALGQPTGVSCLKRPVTGPSLVRRLNDLMEGQPALAHAL